MALKHARPEEVVDLRPLGAALEGAKTSALVRTSAFEAIRLIVPAGAELPPHKVSGQITLHCLEGHVQLGTSKAVLDLQTGDWVYLEGGEMHWPKGLEPSSLLLTILFKNSAAVKS